MKKKPVVNNLELEHQNAYISTLLKNLELEEDYKSVAEMKKLISDSMCEWIYITPPPIVPPMADFILMIVEQEYCAAITKQKQKIIGDPELLADGWYLLNMTRKNGKDYVSNEKMKKFFEYGTEYKTVDGKSYVHRKS